jgi:hypothetical protein
MFSGSIWGGIRGVVHPAQSVHSGHIRQMIRLARHTDISPCEILALEQQRSPIGLRTGIGKAIAHVQGSGMPPLAELGILIIL